MDKAPVETFEHDIADEIRQKEASITDIASAVGEIGNKPKEEEVNHSSLIISIVTILVLCGIGGILFVGYLYYSGQYDPFAPSTKTLEALNKREVVPAVTLLSLSPTLDKNIGDYLTNVQKVKSGYTITVTSYSPVFSYMIKNEVNYRDELAKAVNTYVKAKSDFATTSSITSSSTPISTSTQSLLTTTNNTEVMDVGYGAFSDITINNQNMRMATTASGTVIYAFIGTQYLVISSSTDGILALKASKLQK